MMSAVSSNWLLASDGGAIGCTHPTAFMTCSFCWSSVMSVAY